MKKTIGLFGIFLVVAFIAASLTISLLGGEKRKELATATPAPTPVLSATEESTHILYVASVDDNDPTRDIYQMDLETGDSENLTRITGDDMNPQVSPDGSKMVFYSNRDKGIHQIYLMDLESRETVQLTESGQNFDPAFSPDGKKIVFKSTRADKLGDIYIMNLDGTSQQNLTASHMKTEEWDPTFTKDGKKIIFVSRLGADSTSDELFSINLDGSDMTQLTNNAVSDWYPSINPTNGKIVFISKDEIDGSDELFTMNEDGSNREIIVNLPGNDDDPAMSPDGQKLIFINNNDDDYDLYIANSDGSNTKKLDDTPYDELSPIFLP